MNLRGSDELLGPLIAGHREHQHANVQRFFARRREPVRLACVALDGTVSKQTQASRITSQSASEPVNRMAIVSVSRFAIVADARRVKFAFPEHDGAGELELRADIGRQLLIRVRRSKAALGSCLRDSDQRRHSEAQFDEFHLQRL